MTDQLYKVCYSYASYCSYISCVSPEKLLYTMCVKLNYFTFNVNL